MTSLRIFAAATASKGQSGAMFEGLAFLIRPITEAWRASMVTIESAAASTLGLFTLKAWPE